MQVEGGVEFRPQLPFVCFFVRDVETTTRYSLRVFFSIGQRNSLRKFDSPRIGAFFLLGGGGKSQSL